MYKHILEAVINKTEIFRSQDDMYLDKHWIVIAEAEGITYTDHEGFTMSTDQVVKLYIESEYNVSGTSIRSMISCPASNGLDIRDSVKELLRLQEEDEKSLELEDAVTTTGSTLEEWIRDEQCDFNYKMQTLEYSLAFMKEHFPSMLSKKGLEYAIQS